VEPPDRDVIQGLAQGDPRAFDLAYARLRPPLYSFLLRLSGRPALAEDLLQETWLRLARTATELPPETQLRPWLFTVARNLYRSHRRWSLLDAERLRELGLLPRAAPPCPFEAVAALATERALEQAVAGLPLDHREALLLCVAHGFSPMDAAPILGISPEAVRQRLARARVRLRQELETREEHLP
jgi:RNA polymerase sigma factor (sigma-70 family)